MAVKSAFEKIHIDESEKGDIEGVLEQLNLPPAVITFIRENKRLVQIVTALIVLTVVTWALYGSYSETRRENAALALSAAMQLEGEAKSEALKNVSENFTRTSSARWAKINMAHEFAQNGKSDEAINLYIQVREDSGKESSLQPLIAGSLAQLYEKNENYSDALTEYSYLKSVNGYKSIGYFGLARISELMADKQKALSIYEEYQNILNDQSDRNEILLVEEKIARIKAAL